MNAPPQPEDAQANDSAASPPAEAPPLPAATIAAVPPTPLIWRLAIAAAIIAIGMGAYWFRSTMGLRGQAAAGGLCFFGVVALFSANLRCVNWRTIGWGFALQVALALLVLKVDWVY